MPPAAVPSSKPRALHTPIDGLIIKAARSIGGRQAKEVERFIKFACVGLLGFIIDFGALFLLQSSLLPPVTAGGENLPLNVALASTIAFALAVGSNFIWNRLWTYPDSRSFSIRRQLTQFAIVSVIGGAVRTFWVAVSFIFFGMLSTSLLQAVSPGYHPSLLDQQKLGTMAAQLIGVIIVMFWNFLANRHWSYNDVD